MPRTGDILGYARVSALQELVDNGTSVTKAARYLGIGRSTAYRVIQETRP